VNKVRPAIVAILALLIVAVPAVASAAFKSTPSVSMSVTTGILLPPPARPTVTCVAGDTKVTWSVSPTTWADGYLVYGKYSTFPEEAVDLTGRNTLTYTYPDAVPSGTAIAVVATKGSSWTSVRTLASTTAANCG
jgi:hypothetical protein